jgi:hypothetical protein
MHDLRLGMRETDNQFGQLEYGQLIVGADVWPRRSPPGCRKRRSA